MKNSQNIPEEAKKNGKEYPFYLMEFLGDDVKTLGRIALRNKNKRRIACLQAFFERQTLSDISI